MEPEEYQRYLQKILSLNQSPYLCNWFHEVHPNWRYLFNPIGKPWSGVKEMIALYFSWYRSFCCNSTAATLAVQFKGTSKTLEALRNCSFTFYCQQQAIHSLKLNLLQPRWFSLSVNSLHIGKLWLPIMLSFFSNPSLLLQHFPITASKEAVQRGKHLQISDILEILFLRN